MLEVRDVVLKKVVMRGRQAGLYILSHFILGSCVAGTDSWPSGELEPVIWGW